MERLAKLWAFVRAPLYQYGLIFHCKKYGTIHTQPRSGRPTKISNLTRRAIVKGLTKRPATILTELESSLAEVGETFQRSVISSGLHKNLLFGRVARWAFLRKANITLCGVCQTPWQILTPGGIFCDLMRLMLSSLVWKQCAMFDANQTKPITQVTPSLLSSMGGGSLGLWGCFSGMGRWIQANPWGILISVYKRSAFMAKIDVPTVNDHECKGMA